MIVEFWESYRNQHGKNGWGNDINNNIPEDIHTDTYR